MEGIYVSGMDLETVQMRRAPAKPRKISEVRMGDERVRVIGLVVDKGDADFTLDDGTGRLTVVFDDHELSREIEVGSKVRVFGTPLSTAGASELHAEIVQRVDSMDLGLYSEVRREAERLERELGGRVL